VSPAILLPGTNRISVAVWQGIGEFGFRLGIARPDGSLYTERSHEVIVLGASGNPGLPGALPALTRSWTGDRFLCPDASHEVALAGEGWFDPDLEYDVREDLHGPVSIGDFAFVSHSGSVEPLFLTPPRAGEFHHCVVGVPCGAGSGTTFDGELYRSVARTGGDIWINGDTFEFAYRFVEGDFDIAADIFDTRLPSGRWSKFGLMVRQSLEKDARFGHIQDVGPDPADPARYARRTRDGVAASCQEHSTAGLKDPNSGEPLAHPRYLRLTRRGDSILARVSATAGDDGRDPRDARNWVTVFADEWKDAAGSLYLGFAFSVHESSGCNPGEIDWLPLLLEIDAEEELPPAGARLSWKARGSVLGGEGLSYRVRADRGSEVSVLGWAGTPRSGMSRTRGPHTLGFQAKGSGPEGAFDAWHDVGRRGPCTPGRLRRDDRGTPEPSDDTYRIEASGRDIWHDGDQFTFAHRALTGDFDVRAALRVTKAPPEERWGKFGLMARWDCRPEAAYFFVHDCAGASMSCEVDGPRTAFRPQGGLTGENREPNWVWWQDVFGAEPVHPACAPLDPDPRANDIRGDARNIAPHLRIVRRGSTFYGYASSDAKDWRLLGAHSWIDVPQTLAVGPAVTSHADCGTVEIAVDAISYSTGPLEGAPDPAGGRALGPPGPAPLALPPIVEEDFEASDGGCPAGWVCSAWGTGSFRPRVVDGRLRLADLEGSAFGSGADRATCAFVAAPIDSGGAYVVEFDVFFRYDQAAGGVGNAPADGLTLCVLGVGSAEPLREAPVGDRGEGLGYARINLPLDERRRSSRELSRNSFALELDTWHNGPVANDGDGGNVSGWDPFGGQDGTGSGPWHVGLDVHASVASVQRNHDLGIRDEDLPDIFDPLGIHVRAVYEHDRVRAWLRPNRDAIDDAEGLLVIDATIEPVHLNAPAAVVGFTAATGSATATMEVDDFALRPFAPSPPVFHRGDANADGALDISDAVFVLGYLFLGGAGPACLEAANADDNPAIEITDGIYALNHLFLGGPPPPAPGPHTVPCGPDPETSSSDLGCASYTRC
jgi:hypothetical protein